jgi:hypothetical protein
MIEQSVASLFPAQVRIPRSRHWSAESQAFASGDVLITYLRNGWRLDPSADIEKVSYEGPRSVDVFHFRLTDGQQVIEMPVLGSPRVYRLVEQIECRLASPIQA